MTVLVTGVGHSGTTFIARLLLELGCDFGHLGNASWTEGPHAMEQPSMAKVAQTIVEELDGIRHLPDFSRPLEASTRFELVKAINTMPLFVKSPAIGYTLPVWAKAGLELDAVIVVHRSIEHSARSVFDAVHDRTLREWEVRHLGLSGLIIAAIVELEYEASWICFPECTAPDPLELLYEDLEDLIGLDCDLPAFREAHARVAKPDMIHYR